MEATTHCEAREYENCKRKFKLNGSINICIGSSHRMANEEEEVVIVVVVFSPCRDNNHGHMLPHRITFSSIAFVSKLRALSHSKHPTSSDTPPSLTQSHHPPPPPPLDYPSLPPPLPLKCRRFFSFGWDARPCIASNRGLLWFPTTIRRPVIAIVSVLYGGTAGRMLRGFRAVAFWSKSKSFLSVLSHFNKHRINHVHWPSSM